MRKHSRKIRFIRSSMSIIVFAIFLSSCGSGTDQAGMYEVPPQETDFVLMDGSEAIVTSSYPGMIEGAVNVEIKAQVTGYLEKIYVQEGDYVHKGQPLFRIKGDVFNEQVNNSDASLKVALANLSTVQLEVNKLKPLVEGKVVTDIQLQEAMARYEAALAQVAQAKASLGSSKLNADFALIKAPVDGFIGRIPNRIGNLVSPGDATALTTLSDINTVFVYFSLSEADFLAHERAKKENMSVGLILADGSTYSHKGILEVASGNIDRNTGSITMKAIFPNPEKQLRSGGAGRVILNSTQENVLKLSKLNVKDIQDKYFVFLLADSNKVAMVPIEIAGSSGNYYLVKSGLKTGDKIATNRIDMLTDGMEVIPTVSKPELTAQIQD